MRVAKGTLLQWYDHGLLVGNMPFLSLSLSSVLSVYPARSLKSGHVGSWTQKIILSFANSLQLYRSPAAVPIRALARSCGGQDILPLLFSRYRHLSTFEARLLAAAAALVISASSALRVGPRGP